MKQARNEPELPSFGLMAGAGQSIIELPAGIFPIEGFTGVDDALEARVVMLAGQDTNVVFVVVDQTALGADALERLRNIVSTACQVKREEILLCVSHTFSAPHILPPESVTTEGEAANSTLLESLEHAVWASGVQARESLRPALVGFGAGTSDVNVNRDVLTNAGWWLGSNDSGPSPKEVLVITVADADSNPIAVLFNHAVQPSVMNGSVDSEGGRRVTADLTGAAARHVEAAYPGCVAAFLIGAAADQAPRLTAVRGLVDSDGTWSEQDTGPEAKVLVQVQGNRLGQEVVRIVGETKALNHVAQLNIIRDTVTVQSQVAPPREQIRPSFDYAFELSADVDLPFTVVRIGDIAMVGVAPELTSVTGAQIVASSPFGATLVMTMVDGAAKYMADEDAFERITYEAMSSRFARGSAERVRDRLVESLHSLGDELVPYHTAAFQLRR